MKKISPILLLISVALATILFIGCQKTTERKLVALVTDVGGIDDKSFNQGVWEGIERYASSTDLPSSEYTNVQSSTDSDYIPNLSTVADEGYRLIIAPGFLFEDSIAEVSEYYPNTHFVSIDTVVQNRSNVLSAVFKEQEGSFLVGVAAGMQALKDGFDSVGFIGGVDFQVIQNFEAGFEQGVVAVAPKINVIIEYAGDFADPQKGQTIAAKLFDQGAGIIYAAAGSTGNGAIKEAKDKAFRGEKAWIIGVDRDQYEDGVYENGKSVILTSMLKRADTVAFNIIQLEQSNSFQSGIKTFNLANDGVGIPAQNPNLSPDILEKIQSFKTKIVNGDIKVSNIPKRLQ